MPEVSTFDDAMLGRIVGRRYRITGPIGRGGMATVYRATDEVLGRDVAVKVMHPSLADDAAFVERFRREAQQAARLNHPSVVAVYDWDREDGIAFMVMELVEGPSLRDVMDARGSLPLDMVRHVIAAVAGGLDHAHAAGIVHRDVKAENVLIVQGDSGAPAVKLADFGIAQAAAAHAARLTTDGVIGSVASMAPEQLGGQSTDARVDVYALGIMAYEMLSGSPAFEGSTPAEIAMARLSRSVPSPGISPEVDGAIARATALRPEDRFVTAGELANALGRAQDPALLRDTVPGLAGVPAYFPTQVLPAQSKRSRRPRRLLAVAVAALLAAAVSAAAAFVALPRSAAVPDLAGLSAEAAADVLKDAGLGTGPTEDVFDDDAPPGMVVGTSPSAGTKLRRGRPVALAVSKGPDLLTVPYVVGKPLEAAQAALRDGGFEPAEAEQAFHPSLPAGSVVSQDPAEGRVRRGSSIALVVSKGPELVAVPDVTGRPKAEAEAALRAAGLQPRDAADFSDQVAAGSTIRTDPAAGKRVAKGGTVTIVVSRGPRTFEMPNLVGLGLAEAKQKAASLGLVVANEYAVPGSGKPKGQVQGQNPPAGTEVKKGTRIDVYVSA